MSLERIVVAGEHGQFEIRLRSVPRIGDMISKDYVKWYRVTRVGWILTKVGDLEYILLTVDPVEAPE